MGIIIHSLESVSFKDLYAAFSSAFKEYDFSLNADELQRTCSTDEDTIHNYFSEYFFEGRLISFVLNGTGMYNNILTAYDAEREPYFIPGITPNPKNIHFQPRIDMSTRSTAICTGSFATQSQSNKNISQIRL